MSRDFQQIAWDERLVDDCRQVLRLAIREDLDRGHDWTTVSLVPQGAEGGADIVARQQGTIAGLPAVELLLAETNAKLDLVCHVEDGARVDAGTKIATLQGSTRDLLTCERIMLNLVGRLSGIATLTQQYVDAVADHSARIYDTRKTTPGWRRLEKYAVGCGGGTNHRTGLFDAVLIKDNHLASYGADGKSRSAGEAVREARAFLKDHSDRGSSADMLVEVEVDTLDQLREALPAGPDIVLLDNMSLAELREAVELRDATAAEVQLEASGGVTLSTVVSIAATGVDRISVGSLTHGAVSLDVALDWLCS